MGANTAERRQYTLQHDMGKWFVYIGDGRIQKSLAGEQRCHSITQQTGTRPTSGNQYTPDL